MKIANAKEMLRNYYEKKLKEMSEEMQQYMKLFKEKGTMINSRYTIIMSVYEETKEHMYGYYKATVDILSITNKIEYGKLIDELFGIYTEYRDKASEKENEITENIMG